MHSTRPPGPPLPRLDRRSLLSGIVGSAVAIGMPRLALAADEVSRVDDLIRRMTIEEKAGQMTCLADSFRPFNPPNPAAGIQDEKRLAQEIRR
ncbi:MAG TPA: beta-glucosidase, partial [Novosphingobium sp.]|nr:beta-glucosidase [Novosphingobium sp.]